MIVLNVFYHAIVITLLFTLLLFIEKMIDFISWMIIGLAINTGYFIIELANFSCNIFFGSVKLLIRGSLYYLMAILYIFWISLFINILMNISNNQNFNYIEIYNITLNEHSNMMNKIYYDVYKNHMM